MTYYGPFPGGETEAGIVGTREVVVSGMTELVGSTGDEWGRHVGVRVGGGRLETGG